MLNKNKLFKDLEDSFAQIEDNIKLFKQGKRYSYKGVSTQLRLLLCDTTTKPLLLKIFHTVAFHPLKGEVFRQSLPEKDRSSLVFVLHGTASVNPKDSDLSDMFEEHGTPMMLEEWLNQNILPKTTIRELILSTTDKESVHSDSDYDETLNISKSISLGTNEIQGLYIVGIGEYIQKTVKDILVQKSSELEIWKQK